MELKTNTKCKNIASIVCVSELLVLLYLSMFQLYKYNYHCFVVVGLLIPIRTISCSCLLVACVSNTSKSQPDQYCFAYSMKNQ